MRKAKRFARPANSRGFVFGIDFIGKVRKRDLAEGEGFEPSVRITVRRLSRAVHSTTLPPFRGDVS